MNFLWIVLWVALGVSLGWLVFVTGYWVGRIDEFREGVETSRFWYGQSKNERN